jgi:hypothetical protein
MHELAAQLRLGGIYVTPLPSPYCGIISLNLLRYNHQTNIRTALYDNALNLEGLLSYEGIQH